MEEKSERRESRRKIETNFGPEHSSREKKRKNGEKTKPKMGTQRAEEKEKKKRNKKQSQRKIGKKDKQDKDATKAPTFRSDSSRAIENNFLSRCLGTFQPPTTRQADCPFCLP